jgi:serine/threonine protein phosphatase PrpC
VVNFIKKLFVKEEEEVRSEATTAPLSDEQINEILIESHKIEPTQFIVGCGRNVGRQRTNNEDSLFTHTSTIAADTKDFPFGIYIVADGMGGHNNGEVASEVAVRATSQYLMNKLYDPLFGLSPHNPDESLQEIMRAGVIEAHRMVTKHAPGGGSTLTAVLLIGTQMTVAHIGDSRAYGIYLDGRMQALTRDHSLVKRLEELGQITSEEASTHPQKSMLYRALGQGEPSDPDVFTASLPQPGYLLLCSDGLWNVVPDDQIFNIITSAPSPHRACQNLIDAANAAGGPDNIAAILVRISD